MFGVILPWLSGWCFEHSVALAGRPAGRRGVLPPGSSERSALPVVALQMTDEDVVARVASMFGRKPGRWQPREARHQETHLVRITGAKAVAWMLAPHPLMGERRRMQIDLAVASHAPNPTALLDDTTARAALRMLASGSTVRDVAEHFGTSIWCIYDLRGSRTHKHMPRP